MFEALGASALCGAWWEFVDANGAGYCQTDAIVDLEDRLLILEAKNTWTPKAWPQVEELYFPVVSAALGKPCKGIQVCKNLLRSCGDPVYSSVSEALRSGSRRAVVHWTGVTGLWEG